MPDTQDIERSTFPVERGDHICAIYLGQQERDEVVVPYLRSGLIAGDKCIAILGSSPISALLQTLGGGFDPTANVNSSQLEVRTAQEAYLRHGRFSSDGMISYWTDWIGDAVKDGFPFARATGEMPWSVVEPAEREEFFRYEAELNRFAPQHPLALVCLYDLDHFGGGIVADLMKTHPKLMLGGLVVENPHYLTPDEYLVQLH